MKQVIVIKVYYKDPFMLCLFYLIFRFGKSPAQRFTSRHQRNDNYGARSIGKQGNANHLLSCFGGARMNTFLLHSVLFKVERKIELALFFTLYCNVYMIFEPF